ncbi:PA2169 family four-helix-bundle protein [Pseudoponticoccus marisrubri]|uniref:DUF2383 domain-containing protein n=1 Tax=Pseudoponticoccus marisrubri TaxID=1685382 RepID=A0A0W7WP41_9RHOB|nr:PA2169 family four-helix-bundle protein [Pseudoponticoccus marisrubri]KUF12370.1 hypothetical protein AVJ23_01155 [Pseudoponticoccus marisrubri]
MSQRLNNLNTIVAVLKSGAEFYRKASRATGKTELESLFIEHAELREKVAVELSELIDEAGHEPAEASTVEQGRAHLTRIGTIFNDRDDTLVSGLEEHEDRTLAAFREAIQHRDNERDKPMLESYMQMFQHSHDKMRALKQAA